MQIDDLRRLVELAEHDRITDAAATLGVPQPTLSRLLARVEAELGTRIFERDPHGVRPNPYGELVLSAAREVTQRYDVLLDELRGLLDPDSGTIRLAFLDSMSTSLVPRILHGFREVAPRVRIALRQEPGHEILADLASGTSELAITSPRPDRSNHGWIQVQRQRLVLAVPADHHLAGRKRVRLAEVADEDFVTVPRGFGFRSLIDELFAAEGSAPRVAFESSDLATIDGLVAAGLGVALLPEQVAASSTTVAVAIAVASTGAERIVGLTWRRDRALTPAAERFLDFVRVAAPPGGW